MGYLRDKDLKHNYIEKLTVKGWKKMNFKNANKKS